MGERPVLINWDGKKFGNGDSYINAKNSTAKDVYAMLDVPRNPEVAALVAAVTKYLGSVGMHKVCKLCFEGKLVTHKRFDGTPGYETNCCGSCSLLGETSCVSKPLGCALWMCGYTEKKFPEARALLEKVSQMLYEASGYANGILGVYLHGREAENKATLSTALKKALREATKLVREATRRD